MGTKYSTISISNYNATPPPDDGSEVAANKIQWATVKTKLTDPHNTAVTAINSSLVTMFDIGPTAKSASYTTTAADYNTILEVTGTTEITLLAAASGGAGYHVTVKNSGAGVVTVASSDLIDGAASCALAATESIGFVVDSAAATYHTLGSYGSSSSDVTLAGGSEDYISLAGQVITAHPLDLDNFSTTGTASSSTFLRGDNTWATPAGGTGLWVELDTHTVGVTPEAAITFSGLGTAYRMHKFVLSDVTPEDSGDSLLMRFHRGGVEYTDANYAWSSDQQSANPVIVYGSLTSTTGVGGAQSPGNVDFDEGVFKYFSGGSGAGGDQQWTISQTVTSVSPGGFTGIVEVINPAGNDYNASWYGSSKPSTGGTDQLQSIVGTGRNDAGGVGAQDGMVFYFAENGAGAGGTVGNCTNGTITVYGLT